MWIRDGCSLLRAFSLGVLLLASFAPAGTAAGRAAPPQAGERFGTNGRIQFEALPLERSGQNQLQVRATINGKPALLAIDSGAPVSAIAVNRLEYFGVTPARGDENVPKRVHINGKLNPVFIARGLQMGSLNLVDEPMVALDLRGSRTAARLMDEEAIDGIIGADILFPTNAVLDCSAQVLILQLDPDAQGGAPGLNYRGFTRIPIEVNANENLYVAGSVNGRRAKLMLDTGSFATLLHQPFVRSMKIPLRETAFTSAGVNVKHRGVQLATISQLSVGSVKLRAGEVGVINLEDYIRGGLLEATPPVAGLLGAEMLQRHKGIIDFRTKTLYLKH